MDFDLINSRDTKTAEPLSIPGRSNHHARQEDLRARTLHLPVRFDDVTEQDLTRQLCSDCEITLARDFEGLLIDVMARLLNVPEAEVDAEIESALHRVCAHLGVERGSLWRTHEARDNLILTHHCSVPLAPSTLAVPQCSQSNDSSCHSGSIDSLPPGTESKLLFPWITREVCDGRSIVFTCVSELPPEAALDKAALSQCGTRSSTLVPLMVRGEVLGAVSFDMITVERPWRKLLVRRLEFLAEVLAQAISRKITCKLQEDALAKAQAQIAQLQDRLQAENDLLKTDVSVAQLHQGIVGRSEGINRVLSETEKVASADCPVLLSGETGTGKELIAQEIHRLSPRKNRPMVLVNCAALPSALVESELFGRERGAYTGALTSQVGRFELANESTILLDEVGELTLEVQAKLLRVLQQGEFQRLGSPKNLKVNVRVIAATNRDLTEEVRSGRFREDLYYRLKVFPITIPPLRDRTDDIPLLVFAFMEEFATRMGKKVTKIPRKSMETLQKYSWPGNIRELRNVIERSVIMSSGDTLKLTLLGDAPVREPEPLTLAEAERQHILKTLERTRWRIKGPNGAAIRLDVQPSTLYSRMQKLGIPHRRQKDEMATLG